MVRQTSKDCYKQIIAEGLLAKCLSDTLGEMIKHVPCTTAEGLQGHPNLNQGRGYVTKIKDQGVLYEVGVRKCKITGRKAIVWDLTDNLPNGAKRPPSKKDIAKTAVLENVSQLQESGVIPTPIEWEVLINLIKAI